MTLRANKTILILLLCVLTLGSCGLNKQDKQWTLGGKLFTSAWIQHSDEYRALCLQAYNIATERVKALTESPKGNKPMAIVTDIDETILDNTPSYVYRALHGKTYDHESWEKWCAQADADTLAGSLTFFKYAAEKGMTIFYVTNRESNLRQETLKNLRRYGFPFANEEHLFTKDDMSSKESRRNIIEKDYEIVMLIGDNLGDFSQLFDTRDGGERRQALKQMADEFGNRFIVLPNPVYGVWESIWYGGYPPQSERDNAMKRLRKQKEITN